MSLAKQAEEKRAVLALLPRFPVRESLDLARASVNDTEVERRSQGGRCAARAHGQKLEYKAQIHQDTSMTKRFFLALSGAALCASLVCGQQPPLTPEQKQQIEAAIPKKAPAKPRKARRLLVTNFAKNGDRVIRGHPAIPAGNYAIELMGKQTGAFEAVFSDDVEMFRPDKIKQFDAICFNNTQGVLFDDPELRKSLLDFITGGHGFVGIHAAIATFVQHPVYDQWPPVRQDARRDRKRRPSLGAHRHPDVQGGRSEEPAHRRLQGNGLSGHRRGEPVAGAHPARPPARAAERRYGEDRPAQALHAAGARARTRTFP